VISHIMKLGREAWGYDGSHLAALLDQFPDEVYRIREDLGTLAAYLCAVTAGDTPVIDNLCLSADNPDSACRTLPYTSVTGPA